MICAARRLIAWGLLLGLLSGCGTAASPTPANSTTGTVTPEKSGSAPLREVTLALNWHPEAEHGGYYAALVHGYYEAEGLKVTIRPGGPGVRVVSDVASGVVAFGVDNADKLLVWRAQQADAVAVMSPLQNSPRCIMVHKTAGIKELQGLAGRQSFTLAMNSDQPFARYLQKRIDLSGIQVVKYPGNVVAFLDNTNYGQQAYSFSEPFLARQKGADADCLMLSDVGFNTYTSLLIARKAMIDGEPDVVARMTRASLKGWRKYLTDPEATNARIHEENPEMGLDVLRFGVEALRPLCLPEGFADDRLGEMTEERWQTLEKQLVEVESLSADAKVAPAFTTQFLTTAATRAADAGESRPADEAAATGSN